MKPDIKKCPRCGSKDVVEIIYGMPTEELFKEIQKKDNYWLGGCCINLETPDPDYHCKSCGYEWLSSKNEKINK